MFRMSENLSEKLVQKQAYVKKETRNTKLGWFNKNFIKNLGWETQRKIIIKNEK